MRIAIIIPTIYLALNFTVCHSQIITTAVNVAIPCCGGFPNSPPYIDSIDIDGDHLNEFWIESIVGVDDFHFLARVINTTELNDAFPFGSLYSRFRWNWYGSGMPNTVLFEWGDWWLPNTGIKYLGFRKINSIADTTYGWVKLDFKEGPSGRPFDTLFILEYAINLIPNSQLYAGQTILSSTIAVEANRLFKFSPNPSYTDLKIENESKKLLLIFILDMNGRVLLETKLNEETKKSVDVSKLNSGIYFLKVRSGNDEQVYKMIKV